MRKDSLIILSGGMDSTTLLYDNKENIARTVIFNYGQKHDKEIEYAVYHSKVLSIPFSLIDLSAIFLLHFKSNLLVTGGDIPNGHYEDEVMKKTVVPFRNGIMSSIAAGIAESSNLKYVLIGVHQGDHAIYPDCRNDFLSYMNLAISKGTYTHICMIAPYIHYTKREIALKGRSLGVNYKKTWSCYKGLSEHCGVCGTCVERKEALQGFDTTFYKEEQDEKLPGF